MSLVVQFSAARVPTDSAHATNLAGVGVVQQHVSGRDIAVHNPPAAEIVQRRGHIVAKRQRHVLVDGPNLVPPGPRPSGGAAGLGGSNRVEQRAMLTEFHEQQWRHVAGYLTKREGTTSAADAQYHQRATRVEGSASALGVAP